MTMHSRILAMIRKIPRGKVSTYGAVARAAGPGSQLWIRVGRAGERAGGALRKQRRGEKLTDEEREALTRWQRLSTARKAAAIGAFAFGTFGLGFTLGGLVFGRWRRA